MKTKALLTTLCITLFAVAFAQDKTYKIGDTGPAGGMIFYDKGNYTDGWRYLEAAPKEAEFIDVKWGAKGKMVGGTSKDIGSGKRNTELIVKALQELGETGRAAQRCTNLNYGGFNDWFLPSKYELDLMYKISNRVTAKKTAGSFNNYYWSSSESDSDKSYITHKNQFFSSTEIYSSLPYDYTEKDINRLVRAVRQF
ncbi:MAG: DUF1566 domain-containing protein [Leptospirales bacterium]|nr:DUF1566 domain-containing protein [Leptospirales bacterium]